MRFRLFASRERAGSAVFVAMLSLIAAAVDAADPLVIDKDVVTVGTNLDVGGNVDAKAVNIPGVAIKGLSGRNVFQDDEKAGNLRVGAAFGVPGIYSEKGPVVVGSQNGNIWLLGKVGIGAGKKDPVQSLDVNGGINATSITADAITAKSVKVENIDLMALVTMLQNDVASLQKSVGERISPTDGKMLRVVRGTIKRNPRTVIAGEGFTLLHDRRLDGIYDIKFTTTFNGTPSATVTQIHNNSDVFTNEPTLMKDTGSGDTRDNAIIVYLTTDRIRIKTGNGHGNAEDRSFSFIVIGPQ